MQNIIGMGYGQTKRNQSDNMWTMKMLCSAMNSECVMACWVSHTLSCSCSLSTIFAF